MCLPRYACGNLLNPSELRICTLQLRWCTPAQIWSDPRFDAVPEPKRKELFQEYRAVLGEVDAYNAANAAKQAAQERAAEASRKVGTPCYAHQAWLLAH